jgi:hypothetical protein
LIIRDLTQMQQTGQLELSISRAYFSWLFQSIPSFT